jgi:uncharacterized protein CbrC (UPF0167 family)
MDLSDMTAVAERVITDDLEYLIEKVGGRLGWMPEFWGGNAGLCTSVHGGMQWAPVGGSNETADCVVCRRPHARKP